jgi:hypothetical protein
LGYHGSDGLGFWEPRSILPASIFLWFRGRSCQPTWELESSVVVEEDGIVGVLDGGILGEGEGGGVVGNGE